MMAAEVTKSDKALKLALETGVGSNGNPTMSTRTISNINPTASIDDLLTLGRGIGDLTKYILSEVKVSTTDTIAEA